MKHNIDNLYLIKLDNNKKFGLIISRIQQLESTESIKNKYFIAKIVKDKYLLINRTSISGKKIYINPILVKVVKSRPLNEILSNQKKYYTDKELSELETWINNVREDFKEYQYINGQKTHLAK